MILQENATWRDFARSRVTASFTYGLNNFLSALFFRGHLKAFIYLTERQKDREGKRVSFYLLVHLPNVCLREWLTSSNLGTREDTRGSLVKGVEPLLKSLPSRKLDRELRRNSSQGSLTKAEEVLTSVSTSRLNTHLCDDCDEGVSV